MQIFLVEIYSDFFSVAVECVSSLAVDSILQMHFLQSGVLWHLLLTLFEYDHTLEESGVEEGEGGSNKQAVSNNLAKLAVRALARLGGYLPEPSMTPDNPIVKAGLEAMLTAYLARQLHHDKPHDVLKMLNSNSENPYLVWNNGTRSELTKFLEEQRDSAVRRGESDPAFGAEFRYSQHSEELVVGAVYLRIYNSNPTFALDDPKRFTVDLLEFISSRHGDLVTVSMFPTELSQQGELALTSLAHVIKNNSGVEMQTIGHFKMLFSLLESQLGSVQDTAVSVISSVTGNSDVVSDISATNCLGRLLVCLRTMSTAATPLIMDTLYAVFSNTKLVKEAFDKGAVIYLLDVFCNSDIQANR